jgi:L-lysine 2,3-aminomutase
MDLQALQRSKENMSAKLPQELVDEIRNNMVSSTISRQFIEPDDHQEDIARVKADPLLAGGPASR